MDEETKTLLKEHAENRLLIILFLSDLPPNDEGGIILTLDHQMVSFLLSKLLEKTESWKTVIEYNKVFLETGSEYFVKRYENTLTVIKKYYELADKLKDYYRVGEITTTPYDIYLLCGTLGLTLKDNKIEPSQEAIIDNLIDIFADVCKGLYGIDRYSKTEFRKWLAEKGYERWGDGGKKIAREAFSAMDDFPLL